MASKKLSNAKFVKRGYAVVEPNHLSARRTGQIYAQLPAAKDIEVLENGQFVKYDYAKKEVNFTGKGEWMMVFNEVKVYEPRQGDADFAMIKTDYNARVYSPVGQNSSDMVTVGDYSGSAHLEGSDEGYLYQVPKLEYPQNMADGTTMVPRVIKLNIGDLYTTNAVDEETLAVGDELGVNANGFLDKASAADDFKLLVVKVYTMPDGQPGVKLQRIA